MDLDDTSTIVMIIGLILLLVLIGPFLTMLIWNWVMPSLGFTQLAFWQACGVYWLCDLLFKSRNYNTKNK